jgi:hypothetical protein
MTSKYLKLFREAAQRIQTFEISEISEIRVSEVECPTTTDTHISLIRLFRRSVYLRNHHSPTLSVPWNRSALIMFQYHDGNLR